MLMYISFGQQHTHRVNGITFDCDSLALIKCADHAEGRERAFELFGPKFMTDYREEDLDRIIEHFPRGVIPVEQGGIDWELTPDHLSAYRRKNED